MMVIDSEMQIFSALGMLLIMWTDCAKNRYAKTTVVLVKYEQQ